MATQPIRLQVAREGEDAWFLERGERPDGTAMVVGDFNASGMDIRVYDRTAATPGTPVYSALAQTVAGVVLAALTVDGFWEGRDSTGYNFKLRIPPATYRFIGGKIYDVEVKLTGTFVSAAWIKTLLFQLSVQPVGST